MKKFHKTILDPLFLIRSKFGVECSFIRYDPGLKRSNSQYCIIRQVSHDGTLMFQNDLLIKTLRNLVERISYHKQNPPDPSRKLVGVNYVVGDLWLSTVYGTVKLGSGNFPGQSQRARIPVVCEWVYES